MKDLRCSCGIVTPDPVCIGIQEGLDDLPPLILWNCTLGSTHGIPKPLATPEQWGIAQDVEDSVRPRSPEMMMAPGR